MSSGSDLDFKVVVIGDSAVGKSCILQRVDSDSYNPTNISTIGMDLITKMVPSGNYQVRLQLWDTAGQERFRAMVRLHSRGAKGVILVYSVDDRESFTGITEFHQSLMADAQNHPPFCVLVANKVDLVDSRLVTKKEGKKLATTLQMPYLECSAKTGVGVTEIVQTVADELVRRIEAMQTTLPARKKSNVQLTNSPFRVGADDPSPPAASSCSC